MKSRLFRMLLLGLIVGVHGLAVADGPPDAKRVEAIAEMLPEQPHGLGMPIDNRQAWDAVARSIGSAGVIKKAESLLGKPMPELTDELYLEFSRNGNRTRCQSVISSRHGRLAPLVFAECLENRGRFLAEIEKTIGSICDEKTWVLPAHDRKLTNFKGTKITVDLRSSALGWELATVDYWLAKRLSADTRRRIHDELQRRVFEPYEGMVRRGKPRTWWLRGTNNWNAVCLAGVTGTALAHIESAERRAFYVASAEKYIQYFLKGFTDDGYCSEGVGYWNYGFGHFVMLAETVSQATGGGVDLMADPRVRQIAQFGRRMAINPGVCAPFADCRPGTKPALWIESYVSRRFDFGWPEGQTSLSSLAGSPALVMVGLFRFGNSTVERTAEEVEPPGLPPRDWFEKAGVLICRPSSASQRHFGVAMKGGHNNEHHNHNDVGSYVVALGNRTPLVDPGSEVYTSRTFSSKRYQSRVLNSWGHPVPRVAGELQRTGRAAAAKILKTEFTEQTDTLVLDLRAAYDVKGLKELTRAFVYSREGEGRLEVTDRVVFEKLNTFGTALVTFDEWERTGPGAIRVGKGPAAVDVRIETGGVPFEIRAEQIQEDLPGRRLPTRLGIDLSQPVERATIKLTIRPAE
ncbi:MAG: heparinase II/III family protein [Pirellulales bacterium]|nr:heparinase II/III family protein [Pirellulales bacterium]